MKENKHGSEKSKITMVYMKVRSCIVEMSIVLIGVLKVGRFYAFHKVELSLTDGNL